MISEKQEFRVLGCRKCGFDYDDGKTLICDGYLRDINGNINSCDNNYHTFCLNPPLQDEDIANGNWVCPLCIRHAVIDTRNNFELAKKIVENIPNPCAAIAGDINNLRDIIRRNAANRRNNEEA